MLVPVICQGQSKKAAALYNQGVDAYNASNWKNADSLFRLSAELYPCRDVYYNLAIINYKLADTCSSCDFFKLASSFGDKEAYGFFLDRCFSIDTIQYTDSLYFSIISKRRCTGTVNVDFYKKSADGLTSMVFLKDSLRLTEKDYRSESFQISNFIDCVVLKECEVQPEYPGGEEALMEYLRDNIKYPQLAREKNIQGTVFIQFIVRSNGRISGIRVLRGIGGGCDEEAIRVIENMPLWIPGSQNGKHVSVEFNIPIRFILQG